VYALLGVQIPLLYVTKCSYASILYHIIYHILVTTGIVSTLMPLVCSALWGEDSDYNLVPPQRGRNQVVKVTSQTHVSVVLAHQIR